VRISRDLGGRRVGWVRAAIIPHAARVAARHQRPDSTEGTFLFMVAAPAWLGTRRPCQAVREKKKKRPTCFLLFGPLASLSRSLRLPYLTPDTACMVPSPIQPALSCALRNSVSSPARRHPCAFSSSQCQFVSRFEQALCLLIDSWRYTRNAGHSPEIASGLFSHLNTTRREDATNDPPIV